MPSNTNEPDPVASPSPTIMNDSLEDIVIIDWNGPNDPQNPKLWPYARKWKASIVVSLFTFVSPVSSSILAPAATIIGNDLGIYSQTLIAMTVSIFILAYAVGPLFLGPLSEIYGRVVVLQLGNAFFLVWCLGCGFAQTQSQMLAFRFLCGIGGSAPLAVGGGALADMWDPEERGRAMAIYSLAPMMGPVVGPIAGGWIAEKTSWRWVFWSICIFDVIVQVAGFFLLRETYAPVLLGRKAERIRKSMDIEKDVRQVRTIYETQGRSWQQIFGKALIRPFALFVQEPIVQVLGIYMAFVYGVLYLFLTTIPRIFKDVYHQSVGIAGLHYISLGVGLFLAAQLNARYMDIIYKRLKERNNGVGRPEYRVPAMIPGSVLMPIGVLIAGWCADRDVHWIGTDIGLALVGFGMILVFQSMQAYVVDAFSLYAASALAAVSCLRSLAGFGFPLFAPAMYKSLGYGKGTTILAAVSVLLGCPAPLLLWKYGQGLREKSKHGKC